jgi:hypothetical protein
MNFDIENEFSLIPVGFRAPLIIQSVEVRTSRNGNSFLFFTFLVLGTEFENMKVFHIAGIEGSPPFVEIGRIFIKKIIDSARGFAPKEIGDRNINSYDDLVGMIIAVEIDQKTDDWGTKNVIKKIFRKGDEPYQLLMSEFIPKDKDTIIDSDIPF